MVLAEFSMQNSQTDERNRWEYGIHRAQHWPRSSVAVDARFVSDVMPKAGELPSACGSCGAATDLLLKQRESGQALPFFFSGLYRAAVFSHYTFCKVFLSVFFKIHSSVSGGV